jgi:hypothetical protein
VNLHQRKTHPTYVPGCFGCKVGTLKVGYSGIGGQDATAQKKWDADLDRYRSAVAQGMQPETTRPKDVLEAEKFSDAIGLPYSNEVAQAVVTNTILERCE